MLYKKIICILFILLAQAFAIKLCGQDNPQAQNVFINDDAQQTIDDWNLTKPNTDFHSSFKPYLSSTLNLFSDTVVTNYHFPIKNKFLSKKSFC